MVYDELGRAPLPRFNEKSLCRLGDGLAQTGAISAEGFRRTVEAVRRFRAIAEAMGVERIDATATEAIRRASNGPELVAAMLAEAGVDVRILSGAEEARFATLGVISGFFRPIGVVGDMGGGSLEVAEALDDQVGERWVSLPLGALPVEALLLEGIGEAKRRVDAMLQEGVPPALTEPVFYAVGGGWRSFAKAHMVAATAPVQVVHGYTLDTRTARDFAKKVWHLPVAKLAAMPGVPARRARTLPAAALVLDRVLKHLAPERVVFSALGLREGWLYSQLSDNERYLDPLVEGAQLVGLPGARVPKFASALVRWTDRLFPGETPADARLRVAICALSDVAWRDHPGRPGRGDLPPPAAVPVHRHRSCRAGVRGGGDTRPLRRQARRSVAAAGDRAPVGERPPSGPDPRPRHPPGLPAVRRRARDPGQRALADHRRPGPARGRQRCAGSGQRGRRRSAAAPGPGDRRARHRGGGDGRSRSVPHPASRLRR